MIYLWEWPQEGYLEKLLGKYDEDVSPDRFLLRKGRRLKADEFDKPAIITFRSTKKNMSEYDCLPNSSLIPLVNQRIRKVLEDLAPDDVQFLDAKVMCIDGELEGYQLVNAMHTIVGIDHEKSVYTKMKLANRIRGFSYLTYKPSCMGTHHIARDQEYLGNLLVSAEVKRIAGLVRPEDFYRPLTYAALED